MNRLTRKDHKGNILLKGSSCGYGWFSFDCQDEEGRELLRQALEKLYELESEKEIQKD